MECRICTLKKRTALILYLSNSRHYVLFPPCLTHTQAKSYPSLKHIFSFLDGIVFKWIGQKSNYFVTKYRITGSYVIMTI